MNSVPLEARTENRSKSGRVRCRYCGDQGQLVVSTRDPQPTIIGGNIRQASAGEVFEEYGPCPFCLLGWRLEFESGCWGPDGFWQGQDIAEIRPLFGEAKVLPFAENARRMRELGL